MKSQQLITTTAQLIRYDFGLEEVADVLDKEALIAYLIPVIEQYLECNLEGLFRILYRLDINEQKVHQILSPTATVDPARALAEEVIKREIEKAKTRITFSQDEGDGSW